MTFETFLQRIAKLIHREGLLYVFGSCLTYMTCICVGLGFKPGTAHTSREEVPGAFTTITSNKKKPIKGPCTECGHALP